MYTIKTLNKISEKSLDALPTDLYEISAEATNPDAIIVRSANMHEMEFPDNLKAIARAGAGVNNIPLDICTEKGIVVFNTPGANANAVKELVIAALYMSSRKIYKGICWAQSLKGKEGEVAKLVEKGKAQFEGPEIKGKKIGVIGLGAIGVMVANDAISLGMKVMGYDPYISVHAAWGLSRSVERAISLDYLLSSCDYITIHVPLEENTKGMINKNSLALMKKGVKIINLARGGLVVNSDILDAIEDGIVGCYVTDFPEEELLGNENIITIPHLGASTPESEENCADQTVKQLRDFLEDGIITNSVNFPQSGLAHSGYTRLTTAHQNIPNMLGQVTTVLAGNKINIADMLNRHRDNIGYNIIDIDGEIDESVVESIKKIDGVKKVRIIKR